MWERYMSRFIHNIPRIQTWSRLPGTVSFRGLIFFYDPTGSTLSSECPSLSGTSQRLMYSWSAVRTGCALGHKCHHNYAQCALHFDENSCIALSITEETTRSLSFRPRTQQVWVGSPGDLSGERFTLWDCPKNSFTCCSYQVGWRDMSFIHT